MKKWQWLGLMGACFGTAVAGLIACQTQNVVVAAPCSGGDCADATVPPDSMVPPDASVSTDPCGVLAGGAISAGTQGDCTYTFGGTKRSFRIYAPASYNPSSPAGVVIDAHGATESATQHAGLEPFKAWPGGLGSGWRLVADSVGALIVTPQGIDNAWEPTDADFIRDIRAKIIKATGVPSAKVFLSGISNGGMLNFWSTCDGEAEFGGISPISSAANGQTDCTLKTPTSMIASHATGDLIISYKYGEASAKLWAEANGCTTGPAAGRTFGGAQSDGRKVCLKSEGDPKSPSWSLDVCSKSDPATTCQEWSGCEGGTKVLFCTVPAAKQPVGGHILYFNDTKLSLAAVTWDFFVNP